MVKWSIERWLAILGVALAIGANAQIVRDTRDDVAKLKAFNEETLPKDYVPREVYNIERMNLKDSIDNLNGTLNKMLDLEKKSGEPARIPSGRMFDR